MPPKKSLTKDSKVSSENENKEALKEPKNEPIIAPINEPNAEPKIAPTKEPKKLTRTTSSELPEETPRVDAEKKLKRAAKKAPSVNEPMEDSEEAEESKKKIKVDKPIANEYDKKLEDMHSRIMNDLHKPISYFLDSLLDSSEEEEDEPKPLKKRTTIAKPTRKQKSPKRVEEKLSKPEKSTRSFRNPSPPPKAKTLSQTNRFAGFL